MTTVCGEEGGGQAKNGLLNVERRRVQREKVDYLDGTLVFSPPPDDGVDGDYRDDIPRIYLPTHLTIYLRKKELSEHIPRSNNNIKSIEKLLPLFENSCLELCCCSLLSSTVFSFLLKHEVALRWDDRLPVDEF